MKNRIQLLTKIAFVVGIVLLMSGGAKADLVPIDNIAPAAGTYSGFTSVANNANSFTLTGISDYDSGGTNDTLSFTLTRTTYAMGSISGPDVTVGTANSGGNTTNWFSNFGDIETTEWEVSNIMYTSGEMDGTTAVFAGFTNIGRTNFTSGTGAGTATIDYLVHTGPVGSTTFTSANTDIDLSSAGTSSTVFVTAEAGSGGIRLRDLDLQFDTVAVPEPTSFAMFLGGLGMLAMRRRRI